MRKLIHYKYVIISFSLSNLIFIPMWEKGLYLQNEYFLKCPLPKTDVLATGANVLIFAMVFWGFSLLARRSHSIIIIAVAKLVFLSAFLIFLNHLRTRYTSLAFADIRETAGETVALGLMLFITGCVIVILLRWNRQLVSISAVLVAILAPYALITFSQAAWAILYDRRLVFQNRPLIERFKPSSATTRLVWMIFDQMDEQQAFEDRPTDIRLSEFDRFRTEAVIATNAYAPGSWTIISMPALITGKFISEAKPSSGNELLLTFYQIDQARRWSETPTVFSRAKDRGLNSAVVGIYHPYCRVLSDLATCSWQSYVEGLEPACASIPCQMYAQLIRILYDLPLLDNVTWIAELTRKLDDDEVWPERRAAIKQYQSLLSSALDAVIDPELSLILIHWPIPHEPIIFDRESRDFATDSRRLGIMDNLVLADHTLGSVRKAMEGVGLWQQTAVVISADHGSKTSVNGKRVQRRIPFMIKLPGQRIAEVYSPELNTVITQDLILEILNQNITTPNEMTRWFRQRSTFGQSPVFPGN